MKESGGNYTIEKQAPPSLPSPPLPTTSSANLLAMLPPLLVPAPPWLLCTSVLLTCVGRRSCHWGICTESEQSSCPSADWCPFNFYRSSVDINGYAESWFSNLQSTIRFLDHDAPRSLPHCWAFPDMLEVGQVAEPAPGAFYTWNRAHFGAWCIISSPL